MDDPESGDREPRPRGRGWEDLESSVALLGRARGGDRKALEQLFGRYYAPLCRWASGRLPRQARSLVDTRDLVQETLLKTLQRIHDFEPRGDGALQAYLRRALKNRIHDEMRKLVRSPEMTTFSDGDADPAPSPLAQAIGAELLDSYDRALAELREEDRAAIVARIELGFDYDKVAHTLRKPSPDAARMAVSRALVKLAKEMGRE